MPNKLKPFLISQFRLNIYEISLSGVLLGLWIASSYFLSFNLGFMRIGIGMIFPVIMGIVFKPFISVILAVVGDNLIMALKSGFAQWMIEYALIYPGIALFSNLIYQLLKTKSRSQWLLMVIIIDVLLIATTMLVMILQNNFISKSQDEDAFFNFSTTTSKIALWTMGLLMFGAQVVFLVWSLKFPSFKLQQLINISSLVGIIIIVFIWLLGPLAQIRYMSIYVNPDVDYYARYDFFLIPRVLKTPLIYPLYVALIYPFILVNRHLALQSRKIRW